MLVFGWVVCLSFCYCCCCCSWIYFSQENSYLLWTKRQRLMLLLFTYVWTYSWWCFLLSLAGESCPSKCHLCRDPPGTLQPRVSTQTLLTYGCIFTGRVKFVMSRLMVQFCHTFRARACLCTCKCTCPLLIPSVLPSVRPWDTYSWTINLTTKYWRGNTNHFSRNEGDGEPPQPRQAGRKEGRVGK